MAGKSMEFFQDGRRAIPLVFAILLLFILPFSVNADTGGNRSGTLVHAVSAPEVLFFYGDGCMHCENIRPFVDDLADQYPEVTISYLEVYNNATNRDRFLQIAASHNTTAGVPTLLIGNTLLVGETDIRNNAEQQIVLLTEGQSGTGTNATSGNTGNCPTTVSGLTFPLVIGCALFDSINPCGLAVLVFLLITMAAAGERRRILLMGGIYIFATFLFHLLVGLGLISLFSQSGLAKLFSVLGGLIAILFGVINIADLLRNRETFFLSISESRKGLLGGYARRASLPAAFVLGILAGILGFTCTGGIYLSILGLMSQGMTGTTGLQWLIFYNIIYVLPLVVVTLLVAFGVPPEQADHLRTSYKRLIRAIISIVLIVLGMIILLGWLG